MHVQPPPPPPGPGPSRLSGSKAPNNLVPLPIPSPRQDEAPSSPTNRGRGTSPRPSFVHIFASGASAAQRPPGPRRASSGCRRGTPEGSLQGPRVTAAPGTRHWGAGGNAARLPRESAGVGASGHQGAAPFPLQTWWVKRLYLYRVFDRLTPESEFPATFVTFSFPH